MVGCRVEGERIKGRLNRKEKVGGGWVRGARGGKMMWEGREGSEKGRLGALG